MRDCCYSLSRPGKEKKRNLLHQTTKTNVAKQESNILFSLCPSTPESESLNKAQARAPRLPPLPQIYLKGTADLPGHKTDDKGIVCHHKTT